MPCFSFELLLWLNSELPAHKSKSPTRDQGLPRHQFAARTMGSNIPNSILLPSSLSTSHQIPALSHEPTLHRWTPPDGNARCCYSRYLCSNGLGELISTSSIHYFHQPPEEDMNNHMLRCSSPGGCADLQNTNDLSGTSSQLSLMMVIIT